MLFYLLLLTIAPYPCSSGGTGRRTSGLPGCFVFLVSCLSLLSVFFMCVLFVFSYFLLDLFVLFVFVLS